MPFALDTPGSCVQLEQGQGLLSLLSLFDLRSKSHMYVRNSIPQWALLGDKCDFWQYSRSRSQGGKEILGAQRLNGKHEASHK